MVIAADIIEIKVVIRENGERNIMGSSDGLAGYAWVTSRMSLVAKRR